MRNPELFYILLILCAFISCNKQEKINSARDFDVSDFQSCTNWQTESNGVIKSIDIDFLNSIDSGFIIPSVRQANNGLFYFSFRLKNKTSEPKQFCWKIYYKNETYSIPEADDAGKINKYSHENFYGSYDDSTVLFRTTSEIAADGKFHEVKDSLRICGNPRHEEIYFKNGVNEKWKRNPRVGTYSFLLVVSSTEIIKSEKIPGYIQNICLTNNGRIITPYYFFQNGEGKFLENTIALTSPDSLKIIARLDPGKGVYVGDTPFDLYPKAVDHSDGNICGNDKYLYDQSCFGQFLHYIDNSTKMENIPLIADVLKDNYSKEEYNWNRAFINRDELISVIPTNAKIPCETVYSDSVNKKIIIHNPASTEGDWKKQNVGVITRQGFTYGKVRIKAKLTEIVNKNGMWNGLTNALWLISQSMEDWNLRRPCENEGYMSSYWGGKEDKRVERVAYSEIDFEILKTPSYCPSLSFPPVYRNYFADPGRIDKWNPPFPEEITGSDGDISVSCTNWDMACWQPVDFGVYCKPISYQGKIFESHRWDKWYRALTQKTPAPDDELFGSDFYYFEIDWRPDEIIWRIGPEPEKMRVVGYMNDKVTSIPNNQMLLIITQEFHNTNWWPGSPYQQNNIPFPANDIFGEIYEVVIE